MFTVTFIGSHSFCQSGIWEELSRMVLAPGLSGGCGQVSAGAAVI